MEVSLELPRKEKLRLLGENQISSINEARELGVELRLGGTCVCPNYLYFFELNIYLLVICQTHTPKIHKFGFQSH